MRRSLKRIVKHRRKCSSSRSSSSSRTYRKKHSHSKRNRKQRGGKTKEEWCSILINFYSTECDPSKESIKEAFNALQFKNVQFENCDLLKRLLTKRDSAVGPSLAVIIGSNLSPDDIIKYESDVMTQILLQNNEFRPYWNGLISKDNKLANWLNFVRLIYRNVNKLAKQEPTYTSKPKPTPTPSKSQASAAAAAAAADEWGPAPVEQVPGPQLPEGWTRSGPDYNPIYFTTNGHSQYEVPTMSASAAALAKRLAQINDDNYEPLPLTQKDQESAKQSGAWLPDPGSEYDRLMAVNLDD